MPIPEIAAPHCFGAAISGIGKNFHELQRLYYFRVNPAHKHSEIAARRAPLSPPNLIARLTLTNWRNASLGYKTPIMDMVFRFGTMYMVRRGYTIYQLVSWLDEQERKAELLPFGKSYWDYLPDMIQDHILTLAEDQLIFEAKEKHISLMKPVFYQIQAHCLWKWLYNTSDFGHYCGNCDELISPEFSFRRHRARCFLNGRVHWVDEGGDPASDEETDEEVWEEEEQNVRENFHNFLENDDGIAGDWEGLFDQNAYVGKDDYENDYEDYDEYEEGYEGDYDDWL